MFQMEPEFHSHRGGRVTAGALFRFSSPARLERDRHLHGAADRPAVAHCRTEPPLADGIGCGAVEAARAAAADQVDRPGHAVGADVHPQQHVARRSEEHTSELQSLMSISYAVFCLTKKKKHNTAKIHT